MDKKMGGLAAAAMIMAATPALAERFEVTFSGTLTTAAQSVDCFSAGCVPMDRTESAASLSFSQTLVFDIGAGAGLGAASSFSFLTEDRNGRPMWADVGSQTIGEQSLSNAPGASLVPNELRDLAGVPSPAGTVTDTVNVSHSRALYTYLDAADQSFGTDVWSAYRGQNWEQDGTTFSASVQLMQTAPFPATLGNIDASFTAAQFIARLRQDFLCPGCDNLAVFSVSAADSASTRYFEYYGQMTQISIRELSVVPEPASVALMLAGLGLVGAAARRRRG